MNEKVTQLKVASGALVVSGVVLFVGVLCVAATAIICLNLVAPLWLAAVIVTVAFLLAIGGIMFAGAKKKLNAADLKPVKSIGAIGEIRHSLQEKVNEITKH
jgi:type III secretory pathway component EscU